MELDKIENLLEKYFAGETSIIEEKQLKDYFSSSQIPQHLEQYKPLFSYVIHTKQEQFNSIIPFKTKTRTRSLWISGVAIVLVLVGVGVFTFSNHNNSKASNLGTCDDPEVAFRETQKALTMISEHVNKGIGSMKYINEYEESKNKIFKK